MSIVKVATELAGPAVALRDSMETGGDTLGCRHLSQVGRQLKASESGLLSPWSPLSPMD